MRRPRLFWSAAVAALAFAASAAGANSAAQPCVAALCQTGSLDPFFRKLARAGERRPGDKPLHILQIGDSHTAGDAVTGGLRDLMQARYGAGGRGVMPPGRPYRGYLSYGATVAMSAGWTVKASFGPDSKEPRPLLGLSGFSLTSTVEGASMTLTADPAQAFDRFTVCALAQPGAGDLLIEVGFTAVEFKLNSFAVRPECKTVELPQPQLTARIVTKDGPVTVTSWASFRDNGGIALSNVGVVGSQLVHFGRTADTVIAEELRAYKPDLVVIAFGTNEGFAPRVRPNEYELVLRSQIARIRRLIGHVPILMLGAPDAQTRNAALMANAPGERIDCKSRTATIDDIMATLRASEAAGEGAQTPFEPEADPAGRALFAPPGLAAVRTIQRRVAADLNIAFWDWQARMGGACSAARMVSADPPLMRGDFVHFNKAGGWEIAKLLEADLSAAAADRR